MPIVAEWTDKDERIIVQRYSGRWTWDDLYAVETAIRAMIDEAKQPVHLIIDVTKNVWYPPEMAEQADRVIGEIDPRLGMIILVGRAIDREMLNVLADQDEIFLTRYGFAYDLETAERMIHDWNESHNTL